MAKSTSKHESWWRLALALSRALSRLRQGSLTYRMRRYPADMGFRMGRQEALYQLKCQRLGDVREERRKLQQQVASLENRLELAQARLAEYRRKEATAIAAANHETAPAPAVETAHVASAE